MSNRQNSLTPSITISDRGAAGEGSDERPSSPNSGRKSPRLGLAFLRRKSADAGAASDNEDDESGGTGNTGFSAARRPSIMSIITSTRGKESDHERPLSPHSQGGSSRPSSPLFGSTLKQWRSKSPFGNRRRGPEHTTTEEENVSEGNEEPNDPSTYSMSEPDPLGGGTGKRLSWGDTEPEPSDEASSAGHPEGSGSGSGNRRIR